MIKVTVTSNKVIIKGHSGYAQSGKDIVCAGVSALFYAFLGYLEKRGLLKECRADKGDSFVVFDRDCKEALMMFKEGVRQIEEAYPENVSVVIYKK